MDTVWNSLDPAAKRERLQQALGAWFGIQFIGKEQVFMATMNAYIAEK
jgi:CBS-domain-containing membrane protein